MSLEKLVWGGEVTKEFDVIIKGTTHKVVLRSLNTEDTLAMDLNIISQEKPDTKQILTDAVSMLSRSIISIDGNIPDSAEETKDLLMKHTQPGDVFRLLEKFQTLSENTAAEVKN
jgi:hypothetical protein